MPDAAFVTALLAGLTTGSLHCLAMCGGFAALGAARGNTAPLLPARRLAAERMATQLGRLATYAALGAALGSLGGAAFSLAWPAWQRGLYAVANGALLLAGLAMFGARVRGATLERAGLALFRRVGPAAQPLLRQGGLRGRFALGLLWGLTPCALIYAILPLALLSGSAARGALVMAGLWLGTLPALLLAGGALRALAARFGTLAPRRAAAALVTVFALIGLYRVVLAPETLTAGPFCLVP